MKYIATDPFRSTSSTTEATINQLSTSGNVGIHKNTITGGISLVYNDGGIVRNIVNYGSLTVSGNATPGVPGIKFLTLTDAAPITITNFPSGALGQDLFVICNSNITVQNNANIKLASATNFTSASGGGTLYLYNDGSIWKEINRVAY